MNTAYWAGEFVKVILVYIGVMYIWPSIIFRKYLAKKSKTFRFAFCSTASIVLISTLVLGLGLIHLLNKWIFLLVFYGSLLVSIFYKWRPNGKAEEKIGRILHGTYGVKLFLYEKLAFAFKWSGRKLRLSFKKNKDHIIEYILLVVIVIFGLSYFNYASFQQNSYGTSDMYVHHAWVNGLMQGNIFSGGVYPEFMHCMAYAMHVVSGVRAYSIMLFLGGINVSAVLIAAYCFLKEIFHWRLSAILALALFLCVDVKSVAAISSMARLQWTLPQEFGFPAMFLCAAFLMRYLYAEDTIITKKKKIRQYLKDENLLIFVLSLSATIGCHFYATIMAFFICFPIAVCLITRVFRKRKLCGLIIGCVSGVLIAVVPMGLALAEGIPFQGSIGWAMNVIEGSKDETETQEVSESQTEYTEEKVEGSELVEISSQSGIRTNESNYQTVGKKISLQEKIKNYVTDKAQALYRNGYIETYGENRAKFVVLLLLLDVVIWLGIRVCLFFLGFFKKLGITRETKRSFQGYPSIVFASIIFMIMYKPSIFGLPMLVDSLRLCSIEQILVIAVVMVPVDFIFTLLHKVGFNVILQLLSFACVIGIYIGCNKVGIYHGYLSCWLTRYNEAVNVTDDIVRKYPQNSYTIISTTDELYQVIEYGRHEELLKFSEKIAKGDYTIPTNCLFIYVEKQPIQYAQIYFMEGPAWLANDSYAEIYKNVNIAYGSGNNYLHGEISDELADFQTMYFSKLSDSYSNLGSRLILESKINRWCNNFKKKYGSDMSIYFEDERFVCYRIEQNPARLYELGE